MVTVRLVVPFPIDLIRSGGTKESVADDVLWGLCFWYTYRRGQKRKKSHEKAENEKFRS
jgi:hypothetical protein